MLETGNESSKHHCNQKRQRKKDKKNARRLLLATVENKTEALNTKFKCTRYKYLLYDKNERTKR